MTLHEFSDKPYVFLLERLLEMLSYSFYFSNHTLREQKTVWIDGFGFPEVLCCHVWYPSETSGDLNVSQDPATIFRGLSLQCGMEVELKMFEKNIHCSLLLSAFLGFNSLTVCKLFFKAWVLVVQNRIPPSDLYRCIWPCHWRLTLLKVLWGSTRFLYRRMRWCGSSVKCQIFDSQSFSYSPTCTPDVASQVLSILGSK